MGDVADAVCDIVDHQRPVDVLAYQRKDLVQIDARTEREVDGIRTGDLVLEGVSNRSTDGRDMGEVSGLGPIPMNRDRVAAKRSIDERGYHRRVHVASRLERTEDVEEPCHHHRQPVRAGLAHQGQVVIRRRMRLTMSCDHRVIDGGTIARFTNLWKKYLEEPDAMLLSMR